MTFSSDSPPDPELDASIAEALKVCASEPIHLIGSIQPTGVVLVADRTSFLITAASANLNTVFPLQAALALGRPLSDLLGAREIDWLQALTSADDWEGAKMGSVLLAHEDGKREHDAQVFLSGSVFVLEIEAWQAHEGDVFHRLFVPIRDALWKLDAERDITRYAQVTVEQVQVLTGFDRVMMYRFDENWDGEVIAESKVAEAVSYLGNHFPASDIPPQARALYTQNLVRAICDVDAVPVPLIRASVQPDAGGEAIDLSHSWLRSMSPVHVEYLRNMGVRASLSISLVQNGRLWGLIACHHLSPRHVGLRARELDEFIARQVSLKLINMDAQVREELSARARYLVDESIRLICATDDPDTVIPQIEQQLLEMVGASGAVVHIGDRSHALGQVPSAMLMERVLGALSALPAAPVYATDSLGDLAGCELAASEENDEPCGLLVAPLEPAMQRYIMWFRPKVTRTVKWAGEPRKALMRDESAILRIAPRKSFATWLQLYHNRAMAWSAQEIDVARALSLALVEALTKRALRSSEENYRFLVEHSSEWIARLGTDGRFNFVSPACRSRFGWEPGLSVTDGLINLVDEPEELVRKFLAAAASSGEGASTVLRCPQSGAESFWLEVSLRPCPSASETTELLFSARDVTERHAHQLAIEEVSQRHMQILTATGEGMITLDADGRVVRVNEPAQRMLQKRGTLVGMSCCSVFDWQQLHNGDDASAGFCPMLATLEDGEIRQGTRRVDVGQHHSPLIRYACTPLLENGNISGCVFVFHEVFEQKLGSLDVSAEFILDEAVEAVMVTDHRGKISKVNRAFTEITGYTLAEALGQSPRLLKSGVHTQAFYEELWTVIRGKGRWVGEVWNRRKNGEIYPQRGSIAAICDDAGEISNFVYVFSDISRAKQSEEMLFELANRDLLTGLPNRTNFVEQLSAVLKRCESKGIGVTVAFIDLDRFKLVNDALGFPVGDKYLKIVTERLLRFKRAEDLLARWGGDEFALVMEGMDDPMFVSENIADVLAALSEPVQLAGHELVSTASIGIAIYPVDGLQASELIKAADAALYDAKQKGRNGFAFFSRQMTNDMNSKLLLIGEFRRALLEKQTFLVYQPQIDPRNGIVKGVEALVRWQHPVRGELFPGVFLPMVSELGMIGDLGQWVLEEACRQMREWSDCSLPVPKISINVAPAQLKASFVGDVERAIRNAGIEPAQIELEITEGALEGTESARQITQSLRNLGVHLAVDDFGTGYSSLSHIKLFPISCFKIDKSFIDGIPGTDADVAIVRTILALGRSFKVEVVAEGVETAAQVEFLENEGVTNIQGYYFARPMRPEDLARWFEQPPDETPG